jgi:Mn2+/Fe2+ NRAMP family transporter
LPGKPLSEDRAGSRLTWHRLLLVAGPGLVAMLADTDAGSIITVAQSGAQWGYRLLLPNLLLIPFMFVAQEIGLRLALGAGRGAGELVLQRFGRLAAGAMLVCLALSCFGGLVSQMSGLAGVARSLGLPVPATMAVTVVGLMLIVATGSYRAVERVALFFGLFELAFLVMAWRAAPGLAPIAREAIDLPLTNPNYLYLLAANLGTGIIPWVLLYQPAASIDKGLAVGDVNAARLETLGGIVLCQVITSALLIAAASTLGKGAPLDSVTDIEGAFTATLGPAIGQIVFVLGLSGSALVATIVVCLAFAWTMGEVLGVQRSLEHQPWQAPWFYGSLGAMLIAGGTLVASGINLVSISIAAGVLNALLLPPVLGLLFLLACSSVLPEPLRVRGFNAALVGASLVLIGGVAVYSAAVGLLL